MKAKIVRKLRPKMILVYKEFLLLSSFDEEEYASIVYQILQDFKGKVLKLQMIPGMIKFKTVEEK